MFQIIEYKHQTVIQITRGDSAELQTEPYIDTDDNCIYNPQPEGEDKPIVLGQDDYILFCVSSPSGKQFIKRKITMEDYNEQGVLTLKIRPLDTIDLQPYKYLFSFTYMPQEGIDAYTYATGIFEVLPALATVRDLIDKPPIQDDTENGNGNEVDNGGNEEVNNDTPEENTESENTVITEDNANNGGDSNDN